MNERASVVCVWRGCRRQLLALVPYGHWCVCAADAAGVVGRHCHMCPIEASQAIRVSDSLAQAGRRPIAVPHAVLGGTRLVSG